MFYNVWNWCIRKILGDNCELLFLFVIGGVGMGKSYFIKVIYYELLCLFFRIVFGLEKVLVFFVVFNIGGNIFYYLFFLIKFFLLLYELFGE